MTKIIYKINHKLSQQLITKTFNSESWYKGQLRKSAKELKRFWYEENYK
jgi:hypothetical protein